LIAVAPVLRPPYMPHGPWPWIIKKNARSPAALRALLGGAEPPAGGRHFAVPEARLLPVPRPAR